jgi:hypothetical protein
VQSNRIEEQEGEQELQLRLEELLRRRLLDGCMLLLHRQGDFQLGKQVGGVRSSQ